MILALHSAIQSLLQTHLPDLFTGEPSAGVSFTSDTWEFDPVSADPIAGQATTQSANDQLPFDPGAPEGPYSLTRPPYPGPKRIYLRSPLGERITLSNQEIIWQANDRQSFSLALREDRDLTGLTQLEVLYSIVGAATQVKTNHTVVLQITDNDDNSTEAAFVLAMGVLILHRNSLMEQGGANWVSAGYQASTSIKELKLAAGNTPNSTTREVVMTAQVDLQMQRLLDENEGTPIERILSPGQQISSQAIAIEPDVEA